MIVKIAPQLTGEARQLPQDLPRSGIRPIDSRELGFAIRLLFRNTARAMVVQVRIEVLLVGRLDRRRVRRNQICLADLRRRAHDLATA